MNLAKALGVKGTVVKIRMRKCKDVPRFLKKLDAVQKRTAKSKLQLP